MDTQPRIRVMILGAGKGGAALLDLFLHLPHIHLVGIADTNPHAPGFHKARQCHIPVSTNCVELMAQKEVDLIVDVTGDPKMSQLLHHRRHPATQILDGATAKLLWEIIGYEQKLEANLIQAEKLASIGTFVSSITHDVNNPLYAILGYAEHLVASADDSSTKEMAQGIVAATKRIARICRGLGLYAAKTITEKYGGRIGVESAVDQGTTFSLHFPAVTPSPT